MLISPRLSVRQNPSKLSASMITKNNLSEVFQSIQNGRPAPPSDYRYADVLAALREAGVEGVDTLSPNVRDEVEPGSLLHRWIALLAIEEAEGYTQGPKGYLDLRRRPCACRRLNGRHECRARGGLPHRRCNVLGSRLRPQLARSRRWC